MASDTQLLIRGVTVVDPRDGSLQAGQDVRVAGEQIVSVEPTGDGPVGARVVDAAGQYLVPGFNDMHAQESVENLHRIGGVVRGGRYLGPADLDALKEKVAATRSAR